MQGFGDGWPPADETGRALFGLLAMADPEQMRRAAEGLAVPAVSGVRVDGRPTAAAFSPDGRRLAVAVEDFRHRGIISVFELERGTEVEQYKRRGAHPCCLLDLGDGVLASDWRGPYDGWRPPVLVRYADGRAEVLRRDDRTMMRLAPHSGGFVALEAPVDQETAARLLFCAADGQVLRDLPLPGDLGRPWWCHPWLLTADPAGDRLAVVGRNLCLLSGDGTRVLAVHKPEWGVSGVCFPYPGVVATTETDGCARSYRLTCPGLTRQAEKGFVRGGGYATRDPIANLEGRVVIVASRGAERVECADARTLADTGSPDGLLPADQAPPVGVWGSADGRLCAVGGVRYVSIVAGRHAAAMAALAQRPIAAMAPADLRTVTAAIDHTPRNSAPRPFLDLLRACLEHRFSADVALAVAAPVGGDDDIGL
jgi:hypothetical protein